MIALNVRNVRTALQDSICLLLPIAKKRETRNGIAYVVDDPVGITYERPDECVLFDPIRDANPFFHLVESLWMLAGRDDVAPLAVFLPSIARYSDDGTTLAGAYGHRWRRWYDDGSRRETRDQILDAVERLAANPDDRRGGTIAIFDGNYDPISIDCGGRDVPCNLAATLQVSAIGELDLVVFNRSNDAVWGAFGANAVHFAFLQRYVADLLDRTIGKYTQVTSNLHFYENEQLQKLRSTRATTGAGERYDYDVEPFGRLVEQFERFDRENADLIFSIANGVELDASDFEEPFLRYVAVPLVVAWRIDESGGKTAKSAEDAARFLDVVANDVRGENGKKIDWIVAGSEWLGRRVRSRTTKREDG